MAAIEGATTEIGMGNALDRETLTEKLQFLGLGRRVGKFVSQHSHVAVVRLKLAMADLQRRLVGQDRELCRLAEVNGRRRSRTFSLRASSDGRWQHEG
jgi:hypothetical protein